MRAYLLREVHHRAQGVAKLAEKLFEGRIPEVSSELHDELNRQMRRLVTEFTTQRSAAGECPCCNAELLSFAASFASLDFAQHELTLTQRDRAARVIYADAISNDDAIIIVPINPAA